jgi:hypothetical protein
MKVIFIMHLVYGIGNKTFYGCIYRKIKGPLILGELPQWCCINKNRKDGLPGYLRKNGIQCWVSSNKAIHVELVVTKKYTLS